MDDIIKSVSTREAATAIWLCAFALFAASNKAARPHLMGVLHALFKPIIILPLCIAALYGVGEVLLLKHFGWWSLANTKTTILWILTFAFASMFQIAAINDDKSGLRKITSDIISITAMFTFITELKSFSLIAELIAVPTVVLIMVLAEFSKHDPEHQIVAKLMGRIAAIIGLFYLGYSLWLTILDWRMTATLSTLLEFSIPILLSLGFLPFLLTWKLYIAYSHAFSTITLFGVAKPLLPYAWWVAISGIRGDLELLERWRKAILASRPQSKAEVKAQLVALRALRKLEVLPPVVQPMDGWSPYLAIQFMAEYGFDTGFYHRDSDGSWSASSPMRELDNAPVFSNNVAYYVEGGELAATSLALVLNVNDLGTAKDSEGMFFVYCMHLIANAVSTNAAERIKLNIIELNDFTQKIPYGFIQMARTDFVGGLKGGYSRTLEVCRGKRKIGRGRLGSK